MKSTFALLVLALLACTAVQAVHMEEEELDLAATEPSDDSSLLETQWDWVQKYEIEEIPRNRRNRTARAVDPDYPLPANMTIPDVNLEKPIIWKSKQWKKRRADAPIIGGPKNKNFTRVKTTLNLYGGQVEFKKGRTRRGCPCKYKVHNKYRYDHEYYPKKLKHKRRHCGCHKKKDKKPKLPPVLPEYYPHKRKYNATKLHKKPCKKKPTHRVRLVPEYYPPKPCAKGTKCWWKKHKAWCIKHGIPLGKKRLFKKKITPEYYPKKVLTKQERHAKRLIAKGINPYAAPAAPVAA